MGTFDEVICAPARKLLGRPVRLPSAGQWEVLREGGATVLSLTLPAQVLGTNLQENPAATPFFLLCFSYWHWKRTGEEPLMRLTVTGPPPSSGTALLHYRRAWIALEALEVALGDRLEVSGAPAVRWPHDPVVNAPLVKRDSSEHGGRGREHQVEVQLTREAGLASSFSRSVCEIAGFRRQLPLGLFDGRVAEDAHWTPGGGAQADLWSTSPEGDTFHLFELKVSGNMRLGVLPELLVYAWILHRVRSGLPDGRSITGGGDGADAVRGARRLSAWIMAPEVHPLLLSRGNSPLEWFNESFRENLELGMVFYRDGGADGLQGWEPERTWRCPPMSASQQEAGSVGTHRP